MCKLKLAYGFEILAVYVKILDYNWQKHITDGKTTLLLQRPICRC
jgi:hypothetical protein